MAVYAEQILFFAVPHARSFAVQSGLPFPKYCTMALSAEVIGLTELHDFTVRQPEGVAVVRVMAIKAPAAWHVMQSDILVHHFQLSRRFICRHALMTL